jgi:hypothetical protein
MSKKIRIGILSRDFKSLDNWELRIIRRIIDDPDLEISLIIKDGREINGSKIKKIIKIFKSKNLIEKSIFELQRNIEMLLFRNRNFFDVESIVSELMKIHEIKLFPTRRGFLDIFEKKDAEKVKAHSLDIILRFEFNIIRGDILQAAKFGIWSFHHGDNSKFRGGPPGFWEIYLGQSVVGVTLQKLTSELDGGYVIGKAYYNLHWSFVKTYLNIFEQSCELLFKHIRLLNTTGDLVLNKSSVYYNRLYKSPSLNITISYCCSFYYKLFTKFLQGLDSILFKRRYNCWTIFLGSGHFFETTLFRLEPCNVPKGKFWADPFLVQWNGDYYVFFEEYSYIDKKGIIAVGKVCGNEIVDVQVAISRDYHLSYPNCFWDNGELFMIPESSEAERLEIYKCINFPCDWEVYSTAFQGEKIVDVVYFRDKNEDQWLFLNKGLNNYFNSELYIYKIDSLGLNEIIPHKKNPVIIDSRSGRNAGSIFVMEDKIHRPSQNNSNGIYGYGLNVNEILELNLDDYKERKIVSIKPNFKKGLISSHHLHQLNDCFVIDGAFRKC